MYSLEQHKIKAIIMYRVYIDLYSPKNTKTEINQSINQSIWLLFWEKSVLNVALHTPVSLWSPVDAQDCEICIPAYPVIGPNIILWSRVISVIQAVCIISCSLALNTTLRIVSKRDVFLCVFNREVRRHFSSLSVRTGKVFLSILWDNLRWRICIKFGTQVCLTDLRKLFLKSVTGFRFCRGLNFPLLQWQRL